MKSKSIFVLLLIVWSLLFFSGCGFVINSLYGLKNVKTVDEKTILKYGDKFNIPQDKNYLLDAGYFTFISKQDTAKFGLQINNHLQPLQALYFNKNEKIISYHINCYAGGFPNLKWNRNQIMEVFPPLQQAPLDSLVSLGLIRNNIHLLVDKNKQDSNIYNTTVVVFWNRFMGRQTRRFIKTVQHNIKLSENGNVNIVYVNNDNMFLEN